MTGLEFLEELNGYYFKDLPVKYRAYINNFKIPTRVTNNDEADTNYKYVLFERLNRGSKTLTKQEIRNCTYRCKLLLEADKLAEREDVRDLFLQLRLTNIRYRVTEFTLRLIAMGECFPDVENDASKEIDKYLESSKSFSDEKIENLRDKFIKTIDLFNKVIGVGAIRNNIDKANKVTFEAVFINLYKKLDADTTAEYWDIDTLVEYSDIVKEDLHNLISNDEDYILSTLNVTNSKKSIGIKVELIDACITRAILDEMFITG